MLPNVLISTYLEYKKDTDAIASWLASTAKAAGFNPGDLSGPPSQPSKAEDASKERRYILEKVIPVPMSFQSTLDRAIAARASFGTKLEQHGSSVDAELMAPPDGDESSVQDDTLPNLFAGLAVHEPSEAFLSAPDIQRPAKPEADPVDYAAEIPPSFEDAIFALWVLMDDMNKARANVRSIWSSFKDAGFDVVPAAVTTNTVIELVRNMMEDVVPLIDKHGGLQTCLEKCHMVKCLMKSFSVQDLHNQQDPKDNFNYDTYDVANETFLLCFRLIDGFQAIVDPREIPLYQDGTFGTFDINSDRTKKSGTAKFHDDRALLMPFFTDLMTVVLSAPAWPVHDEFLRGMKEKTRTGSVPFYLVFAAQVFLDVTYTLGPGIERGWQVFATHLNFIVGDLKTHLEYHKNLKIKTWPASNDQMLKQLRDSMVWLSNDPLFQVQERLLRREGVTANKDNANRIFRMSPILCGLVLYQYRFRHREAALAVADAWGSIQYAGHLYNTLDSSGLLKGRWEDMDIAKTLLGPESFFVSAEEPRTLADQFKKYCLQMGVSAVALSKKSRKGRELESKSGPRGLKVNAPVTTMFEERYANDSDIVLTAEQVERIVELSTFELEIDEETGQTFLGQIEDEQKLKDKRKLQHDIKNHPRQSKRTSEPRISLGQLAQALANAMQAETVEFCFPYMLMHRWCWRIFRSVRDACDPQLGQILGADHLENETQLPTLTGYILMLACGAEGHAANLGPLERRRMC
ncbi:hypothetical protein LEL_09260 [Akanthomyces lecanii RCEF 1005]|uniref:DUF6604 domain-containing protein n=1 Tax=Akanthomyces lecanii RCEF 1005 TaxID=1081108 RepID=A0A168D0M3_CORDF|nr:hypothetical protein LEL_09260 [Akanthomyces lecanii RCEF 1005]